MADSDETPDTPDPIENVIYRHAIGGQFEVVIVTKHSLNSIFLTTANEDEACRETIWLRQILLDQRSAPPPASM